jgi:rhodanese-related sulfurtransferase
MKIAIVVMLIIILAVGAGIVYASSPDSISPLDAQKLLATNQAVVVDVREIDEVLTGTIKNSINIPMSHMSNNKSSFDNQVEKLPKDKTVIVFCRSGRRSGIVGGILKKKGFKVLNLGGYEDWKKAIPN